MKPLRLSAFAAALVLAACTSSPTTSADPAGPSFDGVNTLGSGNYADDGGNGLGSGNTLTEDGGNGLGSGNYSGDGTASDTTGRGGNGLGSGN
jgi:hypothetical protein